VSTAITTDVRLLGVSVDGAIVTLDLSRAFATVGNPQQIEALAQLVWTVTAVPDVTGVRFAIEGEPVEVPTGDGTLTTSPVGRSAYTAYAPA
jgi:spore germination protein GerM